MFLFFWWGEGMRGGEGEGRMREGVLLRPLLVLLLLLLLPPPPSSSTTTTTTTHPLFLVGFIPHHSPSIGPLDRVGNGTEYSRREGHGGVIPGGGGGGVGGTGDVSHYSIGGVSDGDAG